MRKQHKHNTRLIAWMACLLCSAEANHAQTLALGDNPDSSMPCDNFAAPVEVEFGSRRPVIDTLGWVVGIPQKLLLWDRRADNHNISPQTVQEVTDYIAYSGLQDVRVRVNQYDPIGNWDRLVENKRIAPGWKYTVGTLKQLQYIFLPGRIFGGDEYNPFTNTVNVYSDIPAMALAESAYGRDVHQRQYPGSYATAQMLPLVAMWHETIATDEVLTYVSIRGSSEQTQAIRDDLYARYGVSLGGEMGRLLPDGSLVFQVVGAVAGHATAAIENRQLSHY